MNWYEIENVEDIDSPALVVYRERVHENILRLKEMVGNNLSRLRPHVKTNKMAEVCSMMLAEGISKFKCATIAEAEMLALIGAPDVLLAYQPVGPKANRFISLVKKYPATVFSCLADHIKAATALSMLAIADGIKIPVFIDLNTGMNRTGILASQAMVLYESLGLLPGIDVVGLHAYDGHIHDTDPAERKQHAEAGWEEVHKLRKEMQALSGHEMLLVAGGSPTFPVHALRDDTECSPGTFVFWDWGYQRNFPDEPFELAALVITRVVSIIDEHTITTDLGHKSVAAENPQPRVYFLNAPDLVPVSQSEEHLVLKTPDASFYTPGDLLYGVPLHICPTVALYEKAVVIENKNAVAEWRVIARDRQINI